MTDRRKYLIIGVVVAALSLTGCDSSESKGIKQIPAFDTPTTTTFTTNPYRRPPSEPSRTPDPQLNTTRTTISPDTEDCYEVNESPGDEPDVFEEFCD